MALISRKQYITKCGKAVLVQRKIGLKRMTLRFSKRQNAFVVSAPLLVSFANITKFIDGADNWFAKVASYQKQQTLQKSQVTPGDEIVVLGNKVRVDFIKSPQAKVIMLENVIQVHGVRAKFDQALKNYLKELAFDKFSQYSNCYAKSLGTTFKNLSVKDMKTRFGSCTSRGNLNYCWRVIMAPEEVLAYLCAHEVSHLKEMNHGKKFWALVALLCPDYKTHQQWLKSHGKQLYKFW